MEIHSFQELYGRELDVSGLTHKKLDIAYGPYERNVLDIYWPEEEKMWYPVIVFIHGGGFFKGDKRKYQLAPALQGLKQGYAVVSINYRMMQTDPFPAQIHDAKTAIRWLKANADELELDTDRMAVWGESAGAMLACLIGATQHGQLEDLSMGHPGQTTDVSAVVDWYGPTDLYYMETHTPKLMFDETYTLNEMLFREKMGDSLKRRMAEANPGMYLHERMPAFLIEHGTADDVVPMEISEAFREQLLTLLPKEKVEFYTVEGAGHGVSEFSTQENLERVFRFLDRWVRR